MESYRRRLGSLLPISNANLHTNQETVSVLEKHKQTKHLEHESKCKI